jgi:ornithine cyclodeaminase/alanine dehydrogenase-like protein (mu-crystallin family)
MALLLSEAEVRELFTPEELIDAMEGALAAYSAGDVTQPVRMALQVGARRNYLGVMPAYVPEHVSMRAALGVKLVSAFAENATRGLPTHLATILLMNPETGALEAVMDGRYITEVRTAAVSAVAVRRLAREGAGVLAILGSGVQARSHAELLTRVRRFREIRAWSPTAGNLERFVSDAAVRAAASGRSRTRRRCDRAGDFVGRAGDSKRLGGCGRVSNRGGRLPAAYA